MEAGHSVADEFAALLYAPLDAHLAHFRVTFAGLYGFGELFGQVEVEGLGQDVKLAEFAHRLDARNDGNGDACLTGQVNKTEVFLVVVEDLSHGIVGAEVLLLLEHLKVELQVGRFLVLFGIGSHTVGEGLPGSLMEVPSTNLP